MQPLCGRTSWNIYTRTGLSVDQSYCRLACRRGPPMRLAGLITTWFGQVIVFSVDYLQVNFLKTVQMRVT